MVTSTIEVRPAPQKRRRSSTLPPLTPFNATSGAIAILLFSGLTLLALVTGVHYA